MPGDRVGRPWRAGARLAALSLALVTGGCESPTVAGEAPAYDPTSLTGGVLVSWPLGRTVAVFVDDGADAPGGGVELAASVDRALAAWESATDYGELRLRRTRRLEEADVVLRPAGGPPLVDEGTCGGGIGDGAAFTLLCFDGDTARTLPLAGGPAGRVKIAIVVDLGAMADGSTLDALVAHEIGHAIGVEGHSPDAGDVMHAAPATARPTARDARTLRYLLHQPADVRL